MRRRPPRCTRTNALFPHPALFRSRVSDFVQLLKPRVLTLVVVTGVVGLLIAPGALHPVLAAVAVLCIAVGSGAAGAVNMWYDRDIEDRKSTSLNSRH